MIVSVFKFCAKILTASRRIVADTAVLHMNYITTYNAEKKERGYFDFLFGNKIMRSEWEVSLDVYYAWRVKRYPTTAERERRWIIFFFKKSGCKSISDVTVADVMKICQYVEDEYKTFYSRSQFLKSMSNYMAFFH